MDQYSLSGQENIIYKPCLNTIKVIKYFLPCSLSLLSLQMKGSRVIESSRYAEKTILASVIFIVSDFEGKRSMHFVVD
jgi:hypothetical protein